MAIPDFLVITGHHPVPRPQPYLLVHLSMLPLGTCIPCGPLLRVCKSTLAHYRLEASHSIPSFVLSIFRVPTGHTFFTPVSPGLPQNLTLNTQ